MNTTKAYEDKISAELQLAKAQIEEFEARAKGKMAQAEIETIRHLKAKRHEIEKKSQELKASGEAKVEQVKAEIDAELAKFKTGVEQLATKLKSFKAS
jgi:tRNA U54 and U55 pseudouridine synthase Pus10